MRMLAIVAAIAAVAFADVRCASAQGLRGFAGGGVMSDLNDEHLPAFGGGVLIDLGRPWFSAGAQGEVFVSWPYFAGRGAFFAQGNIVAKGPVRPFVMGGIGVGESAGPVVGAGVEIGPPTSALGLRLAVEDYIARIGGFDCARLGYTPSQCDAIPHRGDAYTRHQVTMRIALVFR